MTKTDEETKQAAIAAAKRGVKTHAAIDFERDVRGRDLTLEVPPLVIKVGANGDNR